jgi:hypothetical protein
MSRCCCPEVDPSSIGWTPRRLGAILRSPGVRQGSEKIGSGIRKILGRLNQESKHNRLKFGMRSLSWAVLLCMFRLV